MSILSAIKDRDTFLPLIYTTLSMRTSSAGSQIAKAALFYGKSANTIQNWIHKYV